MKTLVCIIILASTALLTGCHSIHKRSHNYLEDGEEPYCCVTPIPKYVYPGVESNIKGMLTGSHGDFDVVGWWLAPFYYSIALIDLPFEIVFDTVCLPYDFYKVTIGGKTRYGKDK